MWTEDDWEKSGRMRPRLRRNRTSADVFNMYYPLGWQNGRMRRDLTEVQQDRLQRLRDRNELLGNYEREDESYELLLDGRLHSKRPAGHWGVWRKRITFYLTHFDLGKDEIDLITGEIVDSIDVIGIDSVFALWIRVENEASLYFDLDVPILSEEEVIRRVDVSRPVEIGLEYDHEDRI